jgi:hypothetical protein
MGFDHPAHNEVCGLRNNPGGLAMFAAIRRGLGNKGKISVAARGDLFDQIANAPSHFGVADLRECFCQRHAVRCCKKIGNVGR